jgi:hypothetical protein
MRISMCDRWRRSAASTDPAPRCNIITEMPAGVRLSHLLTHLESTGETVPEPAIFELASLIINAVASLHAWPGGLAHGAINPAHMLLTNDGRVLLTDGVFGGGLEASNEIAKRYGRNFGSPCRQPRALPDSISRPT